MGLFYELIVIAIIVWIIFKLTNGVCRSNACFVGKTALITGGNSGIGYYTALGLAARGCKVIIASRNNTEEIRQKIIKHTNNPNIVIKHVDLTSLESVRAFAKDINETEERLDILINNSGSAGLKDGYTKDDLQVGMQLNHFGGFLLTHLLIDLLKKSGPSRIIFTSSMMAFLHRLRDLDMLNNPYKDTNPQRGDLWMYCNSKLCNIITANELAERLKTYNITVNSVHPGIVNTEIWDKTIIQHVHRYFAVAFYNTIGLFLKSPYDGAQTLIYLAVSNKMQSRTGLYFWDCVSFFVPPIIKDKAYCRKIFEESEKLVKLTDNEKISKCK